MTKALSKLERILLTGGVLSWWDGKFKLLNAWGVVAQGITLQELLDNLP